MKIRKACNINLSLFLLSFAGVAVVSSEGWLSKTPSTFAAKAIEYSDGTVAFSAPPRLNEAVASRNRTAESNATYYLTFSLPSTAEEPLDRITIRLSEGRDPILRFRLDETFAFEGDRYNRGSETPLGVIEQTREPITVTVGFNPPVAPGKTVTVGLRPALNPRFEGVYLFEVRGYPKGEHVRSEFMGYARLSFYSARDRDPFRVP